MQGRWPVAVQGRRFELVTALVLLGLAAATATLVAVGPARPLGVVAVEPADGAADVGLRAQLRVTFARPVDPASARAAVALDPPVDGAVSVAGRRLAFTPRHGLQAGTEYALTVRETVRDQAGRTLAGPVVVRFRTRPLALAARTPDGLLLRVSPEGGAAERLAGPGVEAFAAGAGGALAWTEPAASRLVLRAHGREQAIALPPGLRPRRLEWVPGERGVLVLAAAGGRPEAPYLARLDAAELVPFGPRPGPIDPGSALVIEALKKSLVEVVYGRDTFALTPDGRAAIVRDERWDFALVGLDGTRLGALGPFLAVGDVAPRGDAVAVVDVDPADAALPRQVVVHWTGGEQTAVSPAGQDSHSPRFAHAGDRIVYATGEAAGLPRERRFALEVVELAGGRRRRLTAPPAGTTDGEPRWSPDDRWISFVRAPVGGAAGRVWLVPADGGEARPLALEATDARWVP